MNNKKQNGSYYTPTIIADFIVKRVFDTRHYSLPANLNVLEPSAGDGVFVKSLLEHAPDDKRIKLEMVEKAKKELDKAVATVKQLKAGRVTVNPFSQDYLQFQSKYNKKYDLIIGNPPYIKKGHLTERQLKICESIHKKAELSDKRIKNIWTAFLVSAVNSLTPEGILCFVLPGELLQVSYAKELRDYLSTKLTKIEIFAFNELVFDGIDQDVIILMGTKSSKKKGVSFFHANKLIDLKKPDLIPGNTNIDRKTLDKWTNFILSQEELVFLDGFKNKLKAVNDYSTSQVGIVTAANEYFILSENHVNEFGLRRYCKQILQKSSLLPPCLKIQSKDFTKIKKAGKPAFLLALEDVPINSFPAKVRRYIELGVKKKLHAGYKCALRDNWFQVPSVWVSEGLFVKRSNQFPRIIVNKAGLNVTDAFYRITMKKGYTISDLAFSFLNSLTFIFAELEGRFYGGGVLELIPNEFKNIPIPYVKIKSKQFDRVDKMLRRKEPISKILKYTDEIILKKSLKLSRAECNKIQNIYLRLVNRRLKACKK